MPAGDLTTTDKATYALAGHRLERRRRVDGAARTGHGATGPCDGTWEVAVVALDRRAAIPAETAGTLFRLDAWADDARRLVAAIDAEFAAAPFDDSDIGATLSYHFTLSVAAVHRLELDPLLPAALLPDDWPADQLRIRYRAFDELFQATMEHAARS